MCNLLDFLWHLLTDICRSWSSQSLPFDAPIYVHNIRALIILFTHFHTVNRDILLTWFFSNNQTKRAPPPLHESVDGAESGLANKHLIVQITRVPQRITGTEMNKLTSYCWNPTSASQKMSARANCIWREKSQSAALFEEAAYPRSGGIFVSVSSLCADPDDSIGRPCLYVSSGFLTNSERACTFLPLTLKDKVTVKRVGGGCISYVLYLAGCLFALMLVSYSNNK